MNFSHQEQEKENLVNARKRTLLENILGEDLRKYLWEDDDVTEIQVNADTKIWIDTFSQGNIFSGKFLSPEKSRQLISYVASEIGMTLGVGNRIVTGRIPFTEERFEGILPPLVKPNPVITIRKKPLKIFSLEEYVQAGSLSHSQKKFLETAVLEKKNILVVGPTASGKTTFCNALIREITPLKERLVFLEDTPELLSDNENSVFLETAEGIELLRLFKSSMRLSPRRVIVGEVRGGEAVELITAWNSGHSGGVSTIHSESVQKGLIQLERYIKMRSLDAQEEMIAMTIHCVVVIQVVEGKRKITEVASMEGYENGKYILNNIE